RHGRTVHHNEDSLRHYESATARESFSGLRDRHDCSSCGDSADRSATRPGPCDKSECRWKCEPAGIGPAVRRRSFRFWQFLKHLRKLLSRSFRFRKRSRRTGGRLRCGETLCGATGEGSYRLWAGAVCKLTNRPRRRSRGALDYVGMEECDFRAPANQPSCQSHASVCWIGESSADSRVGCRRSAEDSTPGAST